MKNTTANHIYELIQQMQSNRQSDHGSKEQQWIIKHLDDPQLQQIIPKLSIVALHILSALEHSTQQTGIELANTLKVTRGGITRAAKKLLNYDLIVAHKLPDNQKNLYYSITPQGKKIAIIHDQMHHTLKTDLINRVTNKYSEKELIIVNNFLADLLNAENQFTK